MQTRISRRAALQSLLGTAFLLSGGTVLTGCGGGSSNPSGTPTPRPTTGPGRGTGVLSAQPGWDVLYPTYIQNRKKWTFLVYMNGANDLEEFGSLNMNQMETVGSTDVLNMVVQFKRIANRFDTSNGNWGGTRRYFVTKDSNANLVSSVELARREDLDAGSWQSLQAFVQWGISTFPADRYCLVVWNHGAGWRKVDPKRLTRGVSYDDTTDNHIDTVDIPRAIDMGNGRKWDVLAFDSSLMQMLEVAYEVRNKATYIVGSEESPPGQGYPYDRFITNLNNNPDMSPRDFAIDIAQQTINAYGPNSNITHSVLEASRVASLAQAVDNLGEALYNVKGFYREQMIFARDAAEDYAYPTYKDLLDFVRLISEPLPGTTTVPIPDGPVQNAAALVRQRAAETILKNVRGNLHPRSNGISIYLPSPRQYEDIDIDQANGFGQRYSELAFAKDYPNWHTFIRLGPR